MTNWDHIVSDKELEKAARLRRPVFVEKKDWTSAADNLIEEGWELVSAYANPKYSKFRKPKAYDECFEDAVWMMFRAMGFTHMNKDRLFKMSYDAKNPALTKQIDIFAVEEDTVFIVECKAAEKTKSVSFKTDIEALHGNMNGLRQEVAKEFPGRKVIFIWATKNCILGAKDKERLDEWHIHHFDDSIIQYYTELANHLGTSARYQLLGNILQGQEIKQIKMNVPAIMGKMGGCTYYAFSIEPSKLLKIGFVLHRSKANADMMPTYQRMIKKKRLLEIRKFVDNGGFFPNSIIVSIDTKGKGMQFDQSSLQEDDTNSKIGILHLPPRYHSAYIIDGQHRLYGYTDSDHAEKDCIPVVAFVDMDRKEQLQLFMDINENQKAVSKTLRVTLNRDIFWDSPDYNERRSAIRSKIAQAFGEDSTSPLLNRVVIGEDPETNDRCISVEAIQQAISRCGFLSQFGKKNAIVRQGTFDNGDMNETSDRLFQFLCECMKYVMDNCENEWQKGKEGLLTINRGIQALIRVIDDIVSMLTSQGKIHPLNDSISTMVPEVTYYLDALVKYISGLSDAETKEIKQTFGTSADTKFYRYFEKPISDEFVEYEPDGLEEYFENQTKKYNAQSRDYLIEIENTLRKRIKSALQEKYGGSWKKEGIPKAVFMQLNSEASLKNYDLDDAHKVEEWDCSSFKEFATVAVYGSNWSNIFEKILVRPEDEGIGGKKEEKIAWITTLESELAKLNKGTAYSISKDMFDLISAIYAWLC